jgi:hypothetical protein
MLKPLEGPAMKYLKTVLAGAVIAFTACLPAQAAVQVNESIDIEFAAFVPCANGGAGEIVTLSGPLHVLITYTVNGNRVRGKTHFQPQGLSGVGQSTGDSYRGVGVTQDHFSGSLQNGQYTGTYVNNFRIIGQGPGNNFHLHENFHLTINANGELSAIHDNLSATCK